MRILGLEVSRGKVVVCIGVILIANAVVTSFERSGALSGLLTVQGAIGLGMIAWGIILLRRNRPPR